MRIGIVTDDGTSVSPHFGMAKNYLVVEIEGREVKGKEMRPKKSHQPERGRAHHADGEGASHGEMLSGVRDCEALVARGMGRPMYDAILQAGIEPYLTTIARADDVVRAYVDGTLDSHPEKLR